MVLLLGNYPADQQQSMQRFSAMMLQGLTANGVPAELIRPEAAFGNIRLAGRFVSKWLAYVDKYLLFPLRLKRALRARPSVVHICDHSNAVYVKHCGGVPTLVTCHDLLAVRGALGEETDCPASVTGRSLQQWILDGLRSANAVVCDSQATAADAARLEIGKDNRAFVTVVLLGLSYPYKKISIETARMRLRQIPGFDCDTPYALHVGSNLRRKNREGVLRIFNRVKDKWGGRLVFAGDSLSTALRAEARKLSLQKRITEVENPTNELLEALYNCATALIYPSRFEGFGWPIIEAQACGCPVICSNSGPLPEAAGEAGMFHPVDDEAGFASDLLRLTEPAERAHWSELSLRNAERFSASEMINRYVEIYRRLGVAV